MSNEALPLPNDASMHDPFIRLSASGWVLFKTTGQMGTLRSVRIRIGRAEKVVVHNGVDRSVRDGDGASSANDASDGWNDGTAS